MEYREFEVAPALKPYIECFWTHQGLLPDNGTYRCVPSGNTDIIIATSNGEEWLQRSDVWERVPRAFVTGIWTEPAVLKSARRIEWFGIRFKPEVFVKLFRQPMREMENATLDIRTALGKGIEGLTNQIAEAPDNQRRIALIETYFTRELKKHLPDEGYFYEAIQLIRKHGGQVSTEELSKKVYVCERQLQRAFREYLGITPKTYSRIIRFNRANYLLKNVGNVNWADVTYTCGYADQAHFIRDFKTFAGSNPTALLTDPASLVALPACAGMH